MTSQRRTLSYRLAIAFSASLATSLLTTGCGIGTVATGSTDSFVATPIGGQIKGGPNPIAGATISVWVTNTVTGTAAAPVVSAQAYNTGTLMQTVTSGSDGSFSFSGGYPCPAGQFLYLTSAGGNTGAGTNNLAVLVAALGRCDDLYAGGKYTGPYIYMNELTTVAAAYALNGFATSAGNGTTATVNIGAPATNNASVGSATAAAGLRHAFLNAANLVNINQPSSSANFRVPSDNSGIVPVQLINSLANTLVACINSNGSGSACGTVFGATGTSTSTGNTFLAMLNLAKNPSLAGTGYTTTQYLAAASAATNFYQPVISTGAPPDFSIAIQYGRGLGLVNGSQQGLNYMVSGVLDANDNFYVGNADSATPTKTNLVSFSSNGTLISFTSDTSSTSLPKGLSTDALGNLYVADGPNSAIKRYSISSGGIITATPSATIASFSGQPNFTAVDRGNNVWFTSSSSNQFGKIAAGGTTNSNTYNTGASGNQIAVDPNQDIWYTQTSSSSIAPNKVSVLQNLNTAASPSYNGDQTSTSSLAGESAYGLAFVPNGSSYTGVVTNSISTGGITPITPTIAGNAVLSVTAGTQVTTGFSQPNAVKTDGAGTVWVSDNNNGLLKFVSGGTSGTMYAPCVPSSAYVNAQCFTNTTSNDLAIDATGTIWQVHTATGSITQVIGSAQPAWPLLSLGLLGKP